MQVRWSPAAAEDLERICDRIERDNPAAARRVAKLIYEGCGRLAEFPRMGRASIRMPGRRELVFTGIPYIGIYRILDDAIEISRIYHAAQDWR
jgi:toxin ParE1/3/4